MGFGKDGKYGRHGIDGIDGRDGKDGKEGKDGRDGRDGGWSWVKNCPGWQMCGWQMTCRPFLPHLEECSITRYDDDDALGLRHTKIEWHVPLFAEESSDHKNDIIYDACPPNFPSKMLLEIQRLLKIAVLL